MRFLLDECLSTRLVELLAAAEHDAVHVHDWGLDGHADDEVLDAARREHRIVVSADTDFGELLSRSGASLPSLILFRQTNRTAPHQANILLAHLDDVADDLNIGAVVVFTDDRIRIRRLPIH